MPCQLLYRRNISFGDIALVRITSVSSHVEQQCQDGGHKMNKMAAVIYIIMDFWYFFTQFTYCKIDTVYLQWLHTFDADLFNQLFSVCMCFIFCSDNILSVILRNQFT